MKYICAKYKLGDYWYPTSNERDIKMQASMDMYLDWHHAGIRMGGAGYLLNKYFGSNASEDMITESAKVLKRSL